MKELFDVLKNSKEAQRVLKGQALRSLTVMGEQMELLGCDEIACDLLKLVFKHSVIEAEKAGVEVPKEILDIGEHATKWSQRIEMERN